MSRDTGKKKANAGKGSTMAIGLLLGLILGVAMAGGLAWYLMKTPAPFVNKVPAVSRSEVEEKNKAGAEQVVKPKQAPASAPAAEDGKPRFEFYKVLTDKQDATALPNGTPAAKPAKAAEPGKTETGKPAADKQVYYLQTGAFSNEAEAEKMKAGLIFDGMEVTVLAVNTPDKGTLHKVRVGPYQGADEMNSARARLKQKGIASTLVHAQ